jgi:hypothetical protein
MFTAEMPAEELKEDLVGVTKILIYISAQRQGRSSWLSCPWSGGMPVGWPMIMPHLVKISNNRIRSKWFWLIEQLGRGISD